MRRVVLPVVLLSAFVWLGALAVTPPAPPPEPPPPAQEEKVPDVSAPAGRPAALRLVHPLGDAHLFRPAACHPTCSLVVVSHSRGMTADLSLTRPHLTALYDRLVGAGYAVLVSNDAGPTTWGAPQALTYLADMRSRAVRTFAFSGRTYNFGYSMGGLPALLTAYAGVYPVSGVMLLDAQVSLTDAWRGGNPTFTADIAAAHGLRPGEDLPPRRDPWRDFAGPGVTALPVLVAGSPEDQAVSFARNGEPLAARSTSPASRLLRLTGPHLGGGHFAEPLLSEMLAFLHRLEHPEEAAPVTPAPPEQPTGETR